MKPIRILFLITGLNIGGAEMQLYRLLTRLDSKRYNPVVVSLVKPGPVGEKIKAMGVSVQALGMRRGIPNPVAIFTLARWLRRTKPELVHTWMYHSDLVGGMAAKLAGSIPVVWGIHHSNLDPEGNKRTTIWAANSCARFSRWLPVKIVCCSEASRRVHTALGYDPDRMVVIPNGFDLNLFKPDLEGVTLVRQELGIPENTMLIGMVGRFDPQKDHRNFIKAAALLQKDIQDVQFLLCGDDIAWKNQKLSKWIDETGLSGYFYLLGIRNDIPRIMTALDIASSSSYGEGFPNVVGEAMACGTPCVVTDVGDSALIVGDTGIVVPPKDPDALARAWRELIEIGKDKRQKLGDNARLRIKNNFSLPSVVKRYEELYKCVA